MPDDTATVSGIASEQPITGTPKGNLISRVLDLLHTAEAEIAADETKLADWLKAEIHKL